ncbi:2,3-dihydro-2,3-dihydroxybenzoate dehydrogenase [Actinoplanes teichomyceticus]|uniref:2,3-dihydro-2,3-dihydroxybenzoate dehydrogenase n=1 Tax=Actinoplanes teichomyceticus TaxID=1867 RepID=A0A561WK21_ACTTI|nr:2,3-dihydro-2,3-dihydroxybenzoate dehydrogenase [Actinoplanes teichomyceticus]TWG24211.1 2,3-dihydro-2,3-dihydroxybenzoate dehydrogenase [Actinoplanes teichomyceticus]GIF12942.1 2,3-dihydro-2,3-dihydroxybenzoate dehydrogenase [Actinoplanes teichomyceticus]
MTTVDFAGKIALVTGAAGGIGAAVARTLAARGATVAAVDRDREALRSAGRRHQADGLPVRAFPADVSSSAEVAAAVTAIERDLGPIDLLVNASGVLRTGEVISYAEQDWHDTFAANVNGVFLVSRAVVAAMVRRGSGAVVTIASNAADTPRTGMAAYAASKAAVAMFTKSLGLEVARHGIRCNVVAPGSTGTPMLSQLWSAGQGPRTSIDGTPSEYRLGIPLGKIATPEDVAEATAFLLSDRAGHITLQTLTVDGGATLGV